MKIKAISLSEGQKNKYIDMHQKLLVTDPWSDPFLDKIGLTSMYIQSTLSEILHLSAETEPGVKLNCPNPLYAQFNKLLNATLKSKKEEDLQELLAFLQKDITCKEIIPVDWSQTDYIPDIRVVDTIEEAIGWIYYKLIKSK